MTDIAVTAGDDYELKLVYKDTDGFIIDITDAIARLMVRKSYYSPAIITVSAAISGFEGEMVFSFDKIATAALLTNTSKECYIYDVEFIDTAGEKTTLVAGNITVTQAVTRD